MIKVLKFPLTSKRMCILLHLSTAKTKVALLYHLSKWPLFSLLSDILTSHPVKERFILSQNPIAVKRPWKEAGGSTFPQLLETYSLKCDFSLYFICKKFYYMCVSVWVILLHWGWKSHENKDKRSYPGCYMTMDKLFKLYGLRFSH